MKFIVRRYFSYCSYEIETENEDEAYEKAVNLPIDEGEVLNTLEEWKECN
jgi:Tfp pilus assembly protein PilF